MISRRSALGSKPSLDHPGNADPKGSFVSEPDDYLRYLSPTVTAILVDAAFFLRRARRIFGPQSADGAAKLLHRLALAHLHARDGRQVARLYRIFVYDAPPSSWKGHTAIDRQALDLASTPEAQWRLDFHQSLRGLRKVALRLGEVASSHASWQLRPRVLEDLVRGKRRWTELSDDDFRLDLRQKGVDMRIGVDIASLAYKRQISQIVLVSGDSDFVPAAKLARREGIDFVLDPMWATVRPDLHEHVDGMRSTCPRPPAREATRR